jgi:hypothetical protein
LAGAFRHNKARAFGGLIVFFNSDDRSSLKGPSVTMKFVGSSVGKTFEIYFLFINIPLLRALIEKVT